MLYSIWHDMSKAASKPNGDMLEVNCIDFFCIYHNAQVLVSFRLSKALAIGELVVKFLKRFWSM